MTPRTLLTIAFALAVVGCSDDGKNSNNITFYDGGNGDAGNGGGDGGPNSTSADGGNIITPRGAWSGLDACEMGAYELFINEECVAWGEIVEVDSPPKIEIVYTNDSPVDDFFDIYEQDGPAGDPAEQDFGSLLATEWDITVDRGACVNTSAVLTTELSAGGLYMIQGPSAAAGAPVECAGADVSRVLVQIK